MVGQATFAKGSGMLVSFFPEDLLSIYQVQVVSMVAVVLVPIGLRIGWKLYISKW